MHVYVHFSGTVNTLCFVWKFSCVKTETGSEVFERLPLQ